MTAQTGMSLYKERPQQFFFQSAFLRKQSNKMSWLAENCWIFGVEAFIELYLAKGC